MLHQTHEERLGKYLLLAALIEGWPEGTHTHTHAYIYIYIYIERERERERKRVRVRESVRERKGDIDRYTKRISIKSTYC